MKKEERNKAYKKAYKFMNEYWTMMGLCQALSVTNTRCKNCPEIQLFKDKKASNDTYWVRRQLGPSDDDRLGLLYLTRLNILAFAIAMTGGKNEES